MRPKNTITAVISLLAMLLAVVLPARAQATPQIVVWYEQNNTLTFGTHGWPQDRVNVLGMVNNVGSARLYYRLNPAPGTNSGWLEATLGRDYTFSDKRLWDDGDFNIELFDPRFNDITQQFVDIPASFNIDQRILVSGTNTLELVLADSEGSKNMSSLRTITIQYTRMNGQVYPFHSIDWSLLPDLHSGVDPVDGNWSKTTQGAHISAENRGFDRVLAIGDVSWRHYDVLVPVTPHSYDDGGNFGVIVNFTGHAPSETWDPMSDWRKIGAFAYYSFSRCTEGGVVLRLAGENTPVCKKLTISLGQQYMLRVQSVPQSGNQSMYRMKMWSASQTEPAGWDIELTESNDSRQAGSVLLVAHQSSVTFGDVTIKNLANGQVASAFNPNQPTSTPVTPTVTATTTTPAPTDITPTTTDPTPTGTPEPTSDPKADYRNVAFIPMINLPD